jgi:hypothetical protein
MPQMALTEERSTRMVRKFERVCEILDRYDRDPAKLIPILQAVQDDYRYLPEEVLTYIATASAFPPPGYTGWPRSTPILRWSLRASTSSGYAMGRPAM